MILYRYLDKNLFARPYRLFPLTVFAFVVLCFLLHPQSPFRTFLLSDPDDYMRLNEVINWLWGQGWFDLSHRRLSPGAHTILHWSRLVDLPIAALMLGFHKIPIFTVQTSALMAALLIPVVLLGLLLRLLPELAAPLVGRDRANLATVFLLFAPMTLFNFTPGHIDHHNWQVLIAGFGLLALWRLARDEKGWHMAILAAIGFACGLWIGTEALPWLILFIGCLALIGAWQGGFIARNSAVFGVALMLAVAIVFPLAVPAEDYSSRALSWFSLADVIFAALAGAVLVFGWFFGRWISNPYLRVVATGGLSVLAAIVFFYFVPEAIRGPFADFDEFDSTIALSNIGEAIPFSQAFHIDVYNSLTFAKAFLVFARFLFLPLLALGATAWNVRRSASGPRVFWLFNGIFLLAAFLLAVFWQARVGWFMELFAIGPLTWLAYAWWERNGVLIQGRTRFWSEIGVFLVVGPLAVLLIPAIASGERLYPNLVLFPAALPEENVCPLKKVTDFITGLHGFMDRPYTILAGANEGPELLFRTPHHVLAANFNVAGNQDVYDFFNARDDQKALEILHKWHVDLVLTCRNAPPFYSGVDHPRLGRNAFLKAGLDGNLHLTGDPDHPALIERLLDGWIPDWLKPVEIPDVKDYLLFTVQLPEADKTPDGK